MTWQNREGDDVGISICVHVARTVPIVTLYTVLIFNFVKKDGPILNLRDNSYPYNAYFTIYKSVDNVVLPFFFLFYPCYFTNITLLLNTISGK